ncbi:probable proline--tRNA ligase, mitochondrial [Phlebotomus argentipes]|uniref:probable proline--tRNA ligase, mitochondrial n=1 Tax=Phlebotomus argentipes TaxID=94469 RepID=UPI0028935D80|nr:probable proline--tRNA ligase, mitochondrial [Phlebotomus argentipes]
MNRISKIFQPMVIIPKGAVIKKQEVSSRSHRLMTELGLIKAAANGTFYLMPLVQRSVDKLVAIVEAHMRQIDAQKVTLPILTPGELWKKSGRLGGAINREIMTTVDRHDNLQVLSPTNEESITSLMASLSPISYKQLPLRFYQIGTKFRDEMKPRFGLIRTKEFLMKDLYTFDGNETNALDTYHEVCATYERMLKHLGLGAFAKVEGDAGLMGGNLSHEYHLPATVGDDRLIACEKCGHAANLEAIPEEKRKECIKCGAPALVITEGIEVAHAFLLGDKYSTPLKANYLQEHGLTESLAMGCFGVGVTRLVAAAVEVLSTETDIRWPRRLAPFLVCLIPPKSGSKEEKSGGNAVTEELCNQLVTLPGLADDVVLDDRNHLTIGKRLLLARRMGYPFVIVAGAKVAENPPLLELHLVESGKSVELCPSDLLSEVRKHLDA